MFDSGVREGFSTLFGFDEPNDGVDRNTSGAAELVFITALSIDSVGVCVGVFSAMLICPVVDSIEGLVVTVTKASEFCALLLHLQKGSVSIQVQVCKLIDFE